MSKVIQAYLKLQGDNVIFLSRQGYISYKGTTINAFFALNGKIFSKRRGRFFHALNGDSPRKGTSPSLTCDSYQNSKIIEMSIKEPALQDHSKIIALLKEKNDITSILILAAHQLGGIS